MLRIRDDTLEVEVMKKTLKVIVLAGALALCLLLTVCYQPPDEVNNGRANDVTR